MTDYARGTGSGSMTPGEGTTNTVRPRPNALDPQDRQAICSAICKCNAMPSIGSEGQRRADIETAMCERPVKIR
jgi:hypothetical protein